MAGGAGELAGRRSRRVLPAPFAVPVGFAALLAVGAVAAAGRFGPAAVLGLCAAVFALVLLVAEPATALPLGVIAWLTALGFSHPPYGQLSFADGAPGRDATVLAVTGLAAMALSAVSGRTLEGVTTWVRRPGERVRLLALAGAVGRRRRMAGVALTFVLVPALVAVLLAVPGRLALSDDLLVFLAAVVAVTVVGGFWPGVLAAMVASTAANWYFTPPVRTLSISHPENLLALLLFLTVAVSVASVVHLAARRATDATRAAGEAAALLALARTVLAGDDSPDAVLGHLAATLRIDARLVERVGERWVRVAGRGPEPATEPAVRLRVRPDLELTVAVGGVDERQRRLLDAYAAQAAAALDRQRLRTQAAQAEALAEGNRMRTALLAAVSHDLRTPLASVKAAVSSLRQGDVAWSAEDEAELLATIEESADRLDGLIANLLDLSRLQTGSLSPFLRPTSVEEVAPLALRGLEGGTRVRLEIPDALPLVRTDPGLLERALANLLANALRYSPPGLAPVLRARRADGWVLVEVVDRGPGVPEAARGRMFEPFQRLGDRAPGGVGLGLAVAKGFIEAMGGRIRATETPGGGLTMTIELPAAAPATAARDASAAP